MGKEKSVRLQTSLLNAAERKSPCKTGKDTAPLDDIGHPYIFRSSGSGFYAVFCWLANYNVNYLWAASFCLVLNWYGDSLDGTLARVRNTQRPKYGFFIDHSLDAITTCLFCVGIGLSPMMDMNIALFILAGYLVMSIYTYIFLPSCWMNSSSHTQSLGPTEVRLILIAVYILYIYKPVARCQCEYIQPAVDRL